MKKFNLFKEIITAKKSEVLQAINSQKTFGVSISGAVVYEPYAPKEILIFSGKHTPKQASALTPPTPVKIQDIFGKNYKIVEDDERLLIKAFSNWQELIGVNMPRCSYDDTTADGVAEFSDKEIEEIGWQATEFNINYRNIVEELEAKCDGYVFCIEQEEPQYQFSGLGFLSDDKQAREVAFAFAKKHVEHMIATHEDFKREDLTDDEEEAAAFFGVNQPLSLHKQKITIEHKYRGSIELPDNAEAKNVFFRTKQAYANHEKMSVNILFSKSKLAKLKRYQKGSSENELEIIELYIELGVLLGFDTEDAKKLKNSIIFTNDSAHTSFNITKRLKLINKSKKSKATHNYLFWDIENFSSISSIFCDIIEPSEIQDEDIFLAANPDSLYLKRAEWEANLFDYGKTLQSFNFIKCAHGKNVADDVLLENFTSRNIKNANVFILTFDRELKERFTEETHNSNNLYIIGKQSCNLAVFTLMYYKNCCKSYKSSSAFFAPQ